MKRWRPGNALYGTFRRGVIPLAVVFLSMLVLPPCPGYALEFEVGPDTGIDWETTVSYAAAWRVEDRDARLLSNPNSDDGNRSFDQWDMVNNRFKILSETDVQHGNYGLFIRGKAFFDFVYMGDNHHDSPLTHNNTAFYGGPLDDHQDFTDEAEDRHGNDAELLDAFLYGTFEAGGHNLLLRVGRQVVSWGESLFIQNSISSAQSPLDGTELNVPGVELKDVFLPVGQIYGQVDVVRNLTFAAYYQWEWDESRLDEAGTYFSTSDFLDTAGRNILVEPGLPATIDRVGDDNPGDSGQWGVALRFLAEALNETEFGFYYINYHEKIFQLVSQPFGGTLNADWSAMPLPPGMADQLALADSSSYFLRYADNIRMLGASFGTVVGDTNISGEVSYRRDYPVPARDPANRLTGVDYEAADVLQSQVSLIHNFGPTLLSGNTTLTMESGFNKIYSVSGSRLSVDDFAWGYVLKLSLDYYDLLPRLDLNVPITLKHNVEGVSPVAATFSEDQNSIAASLDFTYAFVWKFGAGYTSFIGDPEDDPRADRDYLSFNIKRTF